MSTQEQANNGLRQEKAGLQHLTLVECTTEKQCHLTNSSAVFSVEINHYLPHLLIMEKEMKKNAKANYLVKYSSRHFHWCGFAINKEFFFLEVHLMVKSAMMERVV